MKEKVEAIDDSRSPGVVPWPKPIDETGRFGIIGEFIDLVEPHTEADPNAILIIFLTYAGNCMGRNFFVPTGSDQQFGNLFTCLIGSTGVGRKGSAMSVVESFFTRVNPPHMGKINKGISTGEGVVYEVHDGIYKFVLDKKTNKFESVLAEPGVPDKRILYVLSEFQQCLANAKKPEATLTGIIRTAWDGGQLQTPAKTSRATATGAHVSIVTAMSREELLALTDATDASSGFLNRFLFVCSRRSKLLPEGGQFQKLYKSELWKQLQARLAKNIDTFEEQIRVSMDADAQEQWGYDDTPNRGLYRDLSTGHVGLWGEVTRRGPQMILRLAMIIVAINGPTGKSKELPQGEYRIRPEHLDAAEEIWRYCDESCKYIFGDSASDPTGEEIHKELLGVAPAGLTRTQIHAIFGNHKTRADIDRGLLWLDRTQKGRYEKGPETGGRPVYLWYAC